MNKTFQYRLYPTKKQQTLLNMWLDLCCETYNAALQERRDAYRMTGISLGYAQQCAELAACKEVRPELALVHSQVLQDVLRRVDRAFDNFFRRVKSGQQPGYPRFRSPSSNITTVLTCKVESNAKALSSSPSWGTLRW